MKIDGKKIERFTAYDTSEYGDRLMMVAAAIEDAWLAAGATPDDYGILDVLDKATELTSQLFLTDDPGMSMSVPNDASMQVKMDRENKLYEKQRNGELVAPQEFAEVDAMSPNPKLMGTR